jgi:energy-coupling factor transporter ATP-binding protein EcfA2
VDQQEDKEMNVKVLSLQAQDFKRLKDVDIAFDGTSLVLIGDKNGQGKTSALDSIAWAVGGDRFRPTNPTRKGAEKSYIKVTLDNGVTVERKGINGALKVTAPNGKAGGQALLNEFVNVFALNLPKFMVATDIEKAKMLLDCFPGLGAKLQALNAEATRIYNERLGIGQIADRKAKYASELPFDPQAPAALLTGLEMSKKMQDALAVNARNDALRKAIPKAEADIKALVYRAESVQKRIDDLNRQLAQARSELASIEKDRDAASQALATAKATTATLQDQDTTAIERELEAIDSLNARFRANESKKAAEDEASTLKGQYQDMTDALESVRAERIKLLASVAMPMDGLTIGDEGQLVYNGQPWDCMSGSEQYRVAVAICAAVNPRCGFVLVDKLESMDADTLHEFAAWLADRGLQVIGTRVGTDGENTLILEDGQVVGAESKYADV